MAVFTTFIILITNKSTNVIRKILNFGEINVDLNGVRHITVILLKQNTRLNKMNVFKMHRLITDRNSF